MGFPQAATYMLHQDVRKLVPDKNRVRKVLSQGNTPFNIISVGCYVRIAQGEMWYVVQCRMREFLGQGKTYF